MPGRWIVSCAVLLGLALPPAAGAAVSDLTIAEVYGGGGNSGAPFNQDFVELRNGGSEPVDLAGLSIQYASASGNTWNNLTPLSGTVPAGGAFLIGESSGSNGAPLPTPDQVGAIAMGAAAGKVALVQGTSAISCTAEPACGAPGVLDLVGYGGSSHYEGSGPAPPPSNTLSVQRVAADTNDNAADFTAAAPTPVASGVGPQLTPIHAIQGATGDDPAKGDRSPLVGKTVTIEGVVTGIDDRKGSSIYGDNQLRLYPEDRGIFVQQEQPDADPRTSEGIFVGYVDGVTAELIGKRVRINGQVAEKFGQTQLNETIDQEPQVLGDGELPAPVELDRGAAEGQPVCTTPSSCADGTRMYYERSEGMRVRASGVTNSGGTNKFGELFFTPGSALDPVLVREEIGGPTAQSRALIATASDAGAGDPANPAVDTDSTTTVKADFQDRVDGVVGPLGFGFSNYKVMVQPGTPPTVVRGPTRFPFDGLPAQPARTLRVTFFNVENFFPVGGKLDGRLISPAEYAAKRDRIVDAIGRLLRRPDVVGVEEVGGLSDTETGLSILTDVAAKLGGYKAFLRRGRDNRFIDVGFLVKDGVEVSDVRQLGREATSTGATCSDEAGKLFDRPPLAAGVRKHDIAATVFVNHFSSKSAPDSCREQQAAFLRGEAAKVEHAIVGGDLNAFEFESPLTVLKSTGLTNLVDGVPAEQRYSFQFNGRLQVLDHILVSPGLRPRVQDFRFAHFDNAYYERGGTDGHHLSDHDPPVLTLAATPDAPPPPKPPTPPGPPAPPTTPTRPAPPAATPIRVSVPSKLRLRDNRIALRVRNRGARSIGGTVRLTMRKGKRTFTIARGRLATTGAHRARTLKLEPTRSGRAALRNRTRVRVRVILTLRDSAGRRATVRRNARMSIMRRAKESRRAPTDVGGGED